MTVTVEPFFFVDGGIALGHALLDHLPVALGGRGRQRCAPSRFHRKARRFHPLGAVVERHGDGGRAALALPTFDDGQLLAPS